MTTWFLICCRHMFSVLCDIRLLYLVFALWTLVKQLLTTIKYETKDKCWATIVEHYRMLKLQADSLNEMIGNNVAMFILIALFYFSVYINKMFKLTGAPLDCINGIIMTIYIVGTFSFLILCCDVINKV